MPRLPILTSWLCGLSLCVSVPGQELPRGTVTTIDGRSLTGTLAVTTDGRVTVATEAGPVSLDVAEVVAFDAASVAPSLVSAPHRIWLRSGLELPAVKLSGRPAASGQPPALRLELPCGVAVEVPMSTVRALRHGGSERPEPALFADDLLEPPANQDLLYVQKDGKAQRSAVTVTNLQADRIDFQLRGQDYDFALVGTAAIVFGKNTGFAADRQPKPRTVVEMATGEHVEGRLLQVGATVQLRIDEGAVLDLPIAGLSRLSVASDRLVWLSDLTPKAEHTPAFDRTWPWTVDRSVAGPGFTIGGRTWRRGIGMVPRTRLTYDLGGRYDVLEATIGIDDRGGPEAHAVFRVLVDGAVAFEADAVTLGRPPQAIRVELAKCRQLTLEVDFGKNYDLGDYCAFADARVVQR